MSHRPRFTSVSVAIGFSQGAAPPPIQRAAWLPLAPDATLSVVHAVPDSVPPEARARIVAGADRELARATEELRALVHSRGGDGVEVDGVVAVGTPFVEIIRHARARAAGLVVLGREDSLRGREGVDGSTAERVVRKVDVPVLLTSGRAEGPYQRVLLAVDLSDAALRVAELGLALLPDDAHVVRVVHAFEVPFAEWFAPGTLDGYRSEHEVTVRAAMRRVQAMLEPFHVQSRTEVRAGDPRTAILREVMRTRADLVVLGTHGRSGVSHALLGSVSQWIMRAAPCDVAITRPARFRFELP